MLLPGQTELRCVGNRGGGFERAGGSAEPAVRFLLLRLKILVEPSGAAAAAAVLHGKLPSNIVRVGVVLSGGNMDFETLRNM